MLQATSPTPSHRNLTARQERVVKALATRRDWIWREEIDRIAGASNGPEIISQLRHIHGLEIDMQRVSSTDRDARPCKPGQYKLAESGFQAALALLGGAL